MNQTDEQIAQEYEEKELNVINGEYGCLAVIDAVLFGLRKGRELEAENTPFLPQIIGILGWQGGTSNQVLDEIKRLKANEKEALDLHCETLLFAEWIGVSGFTWCEADDCYCGKDGLIRVDALYTQYLRTI